MFIDAKKAHLSPRCDEDIYMELLGEAGAPEGMGGKSELWVYGCRGAAPAWENYYAERGGRI